ncbi:MAG: HD domain-containing protein [Treponema sp.]|nr:HD domain-containing protein [Treponema sp.]
MSTTLVAIIEIGSTGIRLNVAEINSSGGWQVVDRAVMPAVLGRDVFTSGSLSRESMLECLAVLQNYRELLSGWGISDNNIHVIATSALRAARNRDVFIDRVKLETGFNLNIVEGIEENRLMYMAVRFALKQDLPVFWRANSMIIEIGGGSTEIMLLRRGQMVAAHSLKLGTIIIEQRSRYNLGANIFYERYLSENIKNILSLLSANMDLTHVRTMVAAGTDMRLAAERVGKELNKDCRIIERGDFMSFTENVRDFTVDDCVQEFRIPYADAEGIIPGLMLLKLFLENTGTENIVVPQVTLRDGYLADLASGVDASLQDEFFTQTIASAVSLGRRFHFDESHGIYVANLCMTIFDALVKEHGMNRRHRVMLETAAILHDIGTFIKTSNHQKHGQYIVTNSEVFGLHQDELGIIGNVINYHRGNPPSQADIEYIKLQREDRILVLKMASILRVADSLDSSHSQRIKNITVERRLETVVLHTANAYDLSTEVTTIEEKGKMFQDVFGYKVILN